MNNVKSYLDLQANRLEDTLSDMGVPAMVTGGVAGPRVIQFYLHLARRTRVAALEARTGDIALALSVSGIRVFRDRQRVIVEFANPRPSAVSLKYLLNTLGQLPPLTALLGLKPNGVPLMADLSSPDVAHVLVAGTTGSGKSVLLQTIAASLVLNNDARHLQLLIIDGKGSAFAPRFSDLAQMRRPQITVTTEVVELLCSLVRYMETGGDDIATVLFIDELADLVMEAGNRVVTPLARLLQRGRGSQIHVIAAAQRPSAEILSGLMRANFPLRLVGRVVSPEDARVAAGRGKSGADNLEGQGDFLAVLGRIGTRFQAPMASSAEVDALLSGLPRRGDTRDLVAEVRCSVSLIANHTQPPCAEDGIAEMAARLRPWLHEHPDYTKTGVVHFLFGPDTSPGGTHWYQAQAALARVLQVEKTHE